MAIGPRELAEHERVEPIRFAAGGAKPRAGGGDLVGMDRHHPQPGVQQPLDQDSVRPLDRDQLHLQTHERVAQRDQPALVVRERRGEDSLARLVSHEQVVLLRRPINAGVVTSHLFSNSVRTSHRLDQEVPLRALIDRPSKRGYVLWPLRGTSPPPGGAGLHQALHGASTLGPLPTAVEATTSLG